MSHTSLLARLKRGDKQAIHEWYRQFSPKLHAFFAVKVRNPHDVDELVHDTFMSCLKSLPLYRGEAGFYGWMLAVARHELADYWRKFYAKKVISVLPLGEQILSAVSHEDPDVALCVRATLARLPQEISELLALKYVDRLSVEAIALRLALSEHVVQSRLYRARNAFRKVYKEIYGEEI